MTADPFSGLRPAIKAMPESGIVEVVNHAFGRPGLIPLWVGEGDRTTPRFICDAAARALEEGHTFYTYQRGIPPLRRALADYLSGIHETVVNPDRITITGAGMQAIMLTVQAIIDPGDEVVMPSPVWPNLKAAIEIMGGVVRPVLLDFSENGWTCDLDRVLDACGPRTKAVFINTPGNPTGWIMPREDMIRLRDFARARGLWIIADEVYGRFAYELGTAPSFLSIMEAEERLVVVNSFSKNWAMTGWRMGWIVGPPSIGQVLESLVQYNTSGVATFQQHAAVAALRDGEPFVQSLIALCRAGRDLVCQRLGALPRVRLAPPQGAFYLFFAVDGEPDSRALAFRLVDETDVGLAPGLAFGVGGERFLRLCFACSTERLEAAMDRLVPALS